MKNKTTQNRILKGIAVSALASICAGILIGQSRGPDWARMRTAATAILGWKVAAPVSLQQGAFLESLDKYNPLFVRNVEGSSVQTVSGEIPKKLDYRLTTDEVTAIQSRLKAINQRLVSYELPAFGSDEAEARKIFEFAKRLNVETVVTIPARDALPLLDKLANEFEVNVAILNRGKEAGPYSDPKKFLEAVQGTSRRIGACVDTGSWMEIGIKPVEGVVALSDRLMGVRLRDRSALGDSGRDVALGSGALNVKDLLDTMYRKGQKPSFITVEPIQSASSIQDLARAYDTLEKALQPVTAERVAELGRTTPIRGTERIRATDRERVIAAVHAAVPSSAQAKPKKPRKLLVMDINVAYPGHGSIPAGNLAIELWGEKDGRL